MGLGLSYPGRRRNHRQGIACFGLVYPHLCTGENMHRRRSIIFGGALVVAAMATGTSTLFAQTSFQSYRCADGSQFIVGFFGYDPRAHLQIDGKSVTLAKRLALSGSRYSGGGVTLKITKSGTTLKHARRPTTACELA
jgi:membrane-bound inhibitor of C-type lysozyme